MLQSPPHRASGGSSFFDIQAGSATAGQELTITVPDVNAEDKIGAMATVLVVVSGVMNPSVPGDYTLTVATSAEPTYVESESYEIEVPIIGGFVYVYNASDILLAIYSGTDALDMVEDDGYFGMEDWTIEVESGTNYLYEDLDITGNGLTLVSATGADDTIIEAGGWGIVVTGDGVTVEGFTIDDGDTAVSIDASGVVLTNCVITDADIGVEIDDGAVTDVDVTNNVIEDCYDGIVFVAGGGDLDDCDISGNEITGADSDGGIVFLGGNDDIDITDNTITGNYTSGIYFAYGAACNNIDIIGNTISGNEGDGIRIDTDNAPTDLVIKENTIDNNEDAGLHVETWTDVDSVFMFNDIYGNAHSVDTDVDITNAIFNWWGSADENDILNSFAGAGNVEYDPWLMDMQGSVSAGSEIEVGDGNSANAATADPVTTLNGKDDASVNVTGIEDGDGDGADIICAFKYVSNPEDDIGDAIAFFDVFMVINDAVALYEISGKLEFYDGTFDEGSVAYFWTGDFWAECSDQLTGDGVVYVDLTEDTVPSFDEMRETPFVVIGGVAPVVGGEVYLPNKLGILAPWVGLALILALAIGWSILSLRRRQAH